MLFSSALTIPKLQ